MRATFGAGCFWSIEEAFNKTKGVIETKVGYSGGKTKNPTYENVCSNTTGHIEVVQVIFNPKIISYKELLNIFWKIHDTTSIDKQGPDKGTQYKSIKITPDIDTEIIVTSSKWNPEKNI